MSKYVDIENIKFLKMTSGDLILSLDRLTRFKHPEIKYYRVFSDILSKYLLSPKLSKKDIKELDIDLLKSLVEKIWNESVAFLSPDIIPDFLLNKIIFDELTSTYNLSDDILSLIDVNFNLNGLLPLLKTYSDIPINLKRLVCLSENISENSILLRNEHKLRFPLEKVLLCEGVTEEILMPKFAQIYGYDFDANGVKLVSAGGKNQVEKMYCQLKDELKIPIFILLDADASSTAERIKSVLRDKDEIYLIHHGEFEDIFSLNLIKRTINDVYKNICESCIADFKSSEPMTKILTEFFRVHELGDFQKAEFAKQLSQTVKYNTDLTDEIIEIINRLKSL